MARGSRFAGGGVVGGWRMVPEVALVALCLVGVPGCEQVDTVRPANCSLLCERYAECVEPIDVDACVMRCEQRVSVSRLYGLSAVICEDCLGGQSCDDVAGCWDTCPVRMDD